MELLKNYDMIIQYHSAKDNVLAEALSRKKVSMGSYLTWVLKNRDFTIKLIHFTKEFCVSEGLSC